MFLKKFPVSELIHGDLAIVLDGYLAEPLLPPERFLPHRHDDIGWQGVVQSKGKHITSTFFTPMGQMSVIEAEVWIRHGTYRIKSDKVRRQHYLLGDKPTHSKDKAWIEAKSTVAWEWSAEKHVDDSPNSVADLPDWIGEVGGRERSASSKKVGKVGGGGILRGYIFHRANHSQPTDGRIGGHKRSAPSKKVGKVVEGAGRGHISSAPTIPNLRIHGFHQASSLAVSSVTFAAWSLARFFSSVGSAFRS